MFRTIQITSPASITDTVVNTVKDNKGILNLRVLRGASLKPPGDSVTIDVHNDQLHEVIDLIHKLHIGKAEGTSFSTSEPLSYVSPQTKKSIYDLENEAVIEEMEEQMTHDGTMNLNLLCIMAVSGICSTVGILNDTLHLVIGGMMIAPGFEAIVGISAGTVLKGNLESSRSLWSVVKGFGTIIIISALTAWLMDAGSGNSKATYLPDNSLINYWTTPSLSSVLISFFASVAGGILITTNRSVLFAGVMVALALVPAASLMGIGAVKGDWSVVGTSFMRLIQELVLVLVGTAFVFYFKKKTLYKRISARSLCEK